MKAATPLLIKGVLEKLALLDGVNPEALRELATQSNVMRTGRGEVIVSRGQRLANVYAVAFGSVKTRLSHNGAGEMVLGLLGPGATFGKSSVLLEIGRASCRERV